MKNVRMGIVQAIGLLVLLCAPGAVLPAAPEEPDEAVLQMVVDLVTNPDRDMRILGLQQVREEVRGAGATKKFTELLPKLPPEGQVGLLEALGDRGDATAKPVVVESLGSDKEEVRTAALRALGNLGGAPEVPLLVAKTVAPADRERKAARHSLVRLRGDAINAAIVAAIKGAPAGVRAALLEVLADRNATETIPTVLDNAEDADASVRRSALAALRALAEHQHTAPLVKLLKAAKDDAERRQAELALLTVCNRGRQACTAELAGGLADADPPARIVLLHALARAGDQQALAAVVARLKDEDPAVRDEAVRTVSIWSDAAVVPELLQLARSEKPLEQILAIRGLVRLASPQKGKPADLKLLGELWQLVKRPQEKRLLLGALGTVPSEESLALVTPALEDPAVADEAGMAAVMIAEKIKDGDAAKLRAAIEKVLNSAKNKAVRSRAENVLKSL